MCTVAMWGEACMSAGLAVFRRRQAVGVAEGAAEGGEAGIAGARPDRLERLVAMGKIGSRTLQPQALHRADDGFAVARLPTAVPGPGDRKSVGEGKSVSYRVVLSVRRIFNTTNTNKPQKNIQ